MSELDIKAAVRARDGHKCRDCGMGSEEHLAKYGHELDVHRLLPGTEYEADWCVTLCRACHGQKPKTITNAYLWPVERTRVDFVVWNMYNPEDAALMTWLDRLADAEGIDPARLIDRILWGYCRGAPLNYSI
jgi:hypothetical protein